MSTGPLQDGFREVMASVCTPVSVVTALFDDLPHGTTVSAFASLSMSPPMVLVSLDRGSDLLAIVERTGRLGINILSSSQADLAINFARKGAAKFTDVPWTAEYGVPRIPGAGGFLACEIGDFVDGGDHVVVLARVTATVAADAAPLTYHGRSFGTHTTLAPGA